VVNSQKGDNGAADFKGSPAHALIAVIDAALRATHDVKRICSSADQHIYSTAN